MGRTTSQFGLLLGVAATVMPSFAYAEDTTDNIVLKPSSAWSIDYGETSCRMGRFFGEGDDKSVLFLEQHNPSSSFDWTLAGPVLKLVKAGRKVKVQFGPGIEEREALYDDGKLAGFGRAIVSQGPFVPVRFTLQAADKKKDTERSKQEDNPAENAGASGLPELDTTTGKSIDWLSIGSGNKQKIILELGNMKKPFMAMNECMESLVKYWGLDPEQQKHRSKVPVWTNKFAAVKTILETYPAEALRAGASAEFNIRIMVDDKGRPTDCVLTNVTTADAFGKNSDVCKIIMARAKFEPALDQDGEPLASYFTTRLVYST
ncbi:energy transducer TonB [Altererythrobacter sp.]|uniref:energy transducer TonB n=1 Tax=Altererythrobacter sp. TaxID=1872480 RepID=UPI003CFFAC84